MTIRPELLRVEGITKAYPGVVANSDVTFAISEGEIHALLGENGAGKSTMVKMIYGLVRPDSGQMTLRGAAYQPSKPAEAQARNSALPARATVTMRGWAVLSRRAAKACGSAG